MNEKEKRLIRLLIELIYSMPCDVFEGEVDEIELHETLRELKKKVKVSK